MKKEIKRIIASVLVCSSLSVSLVSAKETPTDVTYPWMDDVYRLDIQTMYGDDVGDISDDANETEKILCAMGIMRRNQTGKFNPDAKLTKADYEAAIRAVYSDEEVDFDYYNTAYEGLKVYQKEIITKLLSFVESANIDAEKIDVEKYAVSAGILNGVVYSPSKEFTRREFATVLWNTLNCGYVEYTMTGDGFDISVDENKTILKDKLGVYKVKGIMNAMFGLNLYSTAVPDAGYIEIDRVKYNAYGLDGAENLLGYSVEGYAKYDEETEEYKMLNLAVSKKDETVYMNLEDYDRINENNFYYLNEENKEKFVKIDFLKHILYNGDFVPEITEEMLDGNGSILFAKSTGSDEYDIAFIKEYQNFYTKRYLVEDMKLYFANDARFRNEFYLDLDIEDGNVIFMQDGNLKDISTLTQNLSVSVIQNNSKTYTEIIAAKNKKSGSVTSVYEDEVVIDGETFRIDPYYEEASKKTSSGVAKIEWGSTGTFYYTADNMIVYYEPEGTANFALLRKAWVDDEGEDKVFVKVYTHTGEWITYETIEKPEIDGVKVSGEEIVARLKHEDALGANNDNSPTPIRIILKGDKIKFIDTLRDAAEEAEDTERMKECGSFSGQTSWVKGWDMGSSDAHVGDGTPMFIVPTKVDREDEYGISSGAGIPASTAGITYKAYNPDKFLCAKLAIMYGGASADSTDGWNFIYVRRLEERYDEKEDEVVFGVNCYLLTRGKEEIDEKFYKISEDWKEKFGINNLEGSFVGVKFNGDEIVSMSTSEGPYVENNKIVGNYGENFFYRMSGKNTDWVAGTVVDVDVSRNYLLVDTGDDGLKSVVFAVFVIAKTDAKDPKHEAEGISPSEINPGDKIFYWGSLRRAYNCLVIENYEGN